MTQSQKDFEAFYRSDRISCGYERSEVIDNEIASFHPERNKYGYSDVQEAWKYWQASRASLVVELPTARQDAHYHDVMDAGLVKDALDSAGVNYK